VLSHFKVQLTLVSVRSLKSASAAHRIERDRVGESVAPLLQDVGRFLRGQTRHFAEHHDLIVNELWPRLQLLPQGYPQELFKQLFVTSSVLVERFVGMNSGEQSSSAVDCRTVNADGYRRLYFTLLAYFVFQLMLINPAIQDIYLCWLALFCGASDDQRVLLARLRRVQTFITGTGGGHEVWKALMQVLKPGERTEADPGGFGEFMILAAGGLNAALQCLKQQSAAEKLDPKLSRAAEEEIDRLTEYIRALHADFGIKKDLYARS
jgi:hypothetical protein